MKIILADDHNIFRDGLKLMLEGQADLSVVAEVDNADDLKQAVQEHQPDMVITDYRMPGGGSISAIDELRQLNTEMKIIVLTGVQSVSLYHQLLRSDVNGILLKNIGGKEMVEAINEVSDGKLFLSDYVKENLLSDQPELTLREFQVMDLVVEGLSSTEIAEKLNLSPKTVENYRCNLIQKVGVRNSVELVHYVRAQGLLDS